MSFKTRTVAMVWPSLSLKAMVTRKRAEQCYLLLLNEKNDNERREC